jgi:hypothetical protein
MGTEFAFALGKSRYLSAAKLIETTLGDAGSNAQRIYEDGLILWN